MSIKTIEIICIPCNKCAALIEMVNHSIAALQRQYKTKINYSFKFTKHLKDTAKYSVNPAKAPLLIINGRTEGAGSMRPAIIRAKLAQLHME